MIVVFNACDGFFQGRLYGQARVGPDGASLRMTQFRRLAPEGTLGECVLDVCAIVSAVGRGRPAGIPRVASPTRPSELHPGFVFVTTGQLDVDFAR